MQNSRLFEIIYLLLDGGSLTAQQLANRFEVSVRTIYRDVESLSAAGVPVYMSKGRGGGVRLSEGYVLTKSLLSEQEQMEILGSLQSLQAADCPNTQQLLHKLNGVFAKNCENWIEVDFSQWDSGKQNWEQLKDAILTRREVTFTYYGANGTKTHRQVQPYTLWFKEKSWYLKGFCTQKKAMRLFRLTRIKELDVTDCAFVPIAGLQQPPLPQHSINVLVTLTLRLNPSQAYRVYDEFAADAVTQNEDGSFTVYATFPEDEWVYGYILSFGSEAQVIAPEHIRQGVQWRLQKMVKNYFNMT